MRSLLAFFILGCLLEISRADNWAVLIAGSNSFYNYRHQSDICHAYQILTKKGKIPQENIVVMMYDDIARNSENPFNGQIFNKPNGTNVYKGVSIDYKGNAVNKTTFLKVLIGDASAGGKVLKSTAQDDVFIYYSDHGGTGLVAMPAGDYLYADELMKALKTMHQKKMYRQLVFYLEACESGSMFAGLLPSNLSIFATTAANPDESSYAYYYWQPVGTYLGDEYSIRWMEDSDRNWNKHESLITQFLHVKEQVKQSHPQQYGTKSFVNEPISDFQGDSPSRNQRSSVRSTDARSVHDLSVGESVSSRDVKLFHLMEKYASTQGLQKAQFQSLMNEEIRYRTTVDRLMKGVVQTVLNLSGSQADVDEFLGLNFPPRKFDCLREAVKKFELKCVRLNDYGLKNVKNLVQLCESFGTDVVSKAIDWRCGLRM